MPLGSEHFRADESSANQANAHAPAARIESSYDDTPPMGPTLNLLLLDASPLRDGTDEEDGSLDQQCVHCSQILHPELTTGLL